MSARVEQDESCSVHEICMWAQHPYAHAVRRHAAAVLALQGDCLLRGDNSLAAEH